MRENSEIDHIRQAQSQYQKASERMTAFTHSSFASVPLHALPADDGLSSQLRELTCRVIMTIIIALIFRKRNIFCAYYRPRYRLARLSPFLFRLMTAFAESSMAALKHIFSMISQDISRDFQGNIFKNIILISEARSHARLSPWKLKCNFRAYDYGIPTRMCSIHDEG